MTNNFFNSLKTRLFLWYLGSLLILSIVFFLFVHYWSLPYGIDLFFVIFLILVIINFIIIYKITSSIAYLTNRVKMISSKNLDERILNIKAKDEIGELAQNFNELLDRLNEAFKREQQFIADISHEMKTPVSTLRSELEITLQKDRSKEEYQKVIKNTIAETDRLSSALKNVLDLAWTETPSAQNHRQKIHLSELISELSDITKKMALRKKIKVTTEIEKNIYVLGFKDKLARAILNIIDNAIKYSQIDGKVNMILEQTPKKAIITIQDNGKGIIESEIPYIFDRFYRGAKTDKVFGAGLGLAIAKSIINIHEGEIKVKSIIHKGTTLAIILSKLS